MLVAADAGRLRHHHPIVHSLLLEWAVLRRLVMPEWPSLRGVRDIACVEELLRAVLPQS